MSSSKIVYLDGLRGLAAFIVVLAHFFQVFMPSVFEGRPELVHFGFETPASQTPVNILFNGNFSVCLFFVLSGYVLSYRYFRTKDNFIVYSGAVRRYFRLAVPAFVSDLLAFAVMKLGLGYFDEAAKVTLSTMADPYIADPSYWSLVKEGFYHTFFTYGFQYNPVLWTMTYELFGSFMIFAFLLLLGKYRIRFIAYAVLIWHFIDSYFLGFILGLLLSDLHNSGRNWLKVIDRPWVNVFFFAAGVYAGSFPYVSYEGTVYEPLVWNAPNFSFFVFYHVLGSSFIIAALLNSERLQALFGSRLFAYLGRVSFSLYLVHFTVICSLASYMFLRLNNVLPYGLNVLVTSLSSLILIFAAAHVMYRYVDSRTIGLLSRWSGKMFSGRQKGSVSAERKLQQSG